MSEEDQLDPGHSEIRAALRVFGPLLPMIGGGFLIAALVDFFRAFGGSGPPRLFWCAFVGMPMLGVGVALTKLGFTGAVARYVAGEIAPVGKDTLNYVAEETEEGLEALAGAVGRGLRGQTRGAGTTPGVRCHKCNAVNDAEAGFCSERGELNDPDARFCDHCGYQFGV